MTIFSRYANLNSLIRKNMESHSGRNTKTAMMFAVCLSFLIFSAGSFKLVGFLISSQLELAVGTDLLGQVVRRDLPNFLDEVQINKFLNE